MLSNGVVNDEFVHGLFRLITPCNRLLLAAPHLNEMPNLHPFFISHALRVFLNSCGFVQQFHEPILKILPSLYRTNQLAQTLLLFLHLFLQVVHSLYLILFDVIVVVD